MYTAFYGLREKPFALSPNPRFLYLAESHREALAHLLYGLEQGEGFIVITGEVGTGKTTICRSLLQRLDAETDVAFLFNPSRNAVELLQSISEEFGLPVTGQSRRELLSQLNHYLLQQNGAGRRVVLIVDEAQNLSAETLEQVRLLSNLETASSKLIQIILLGQPELDVKLDSDELRQLRQRISVRWSLEPLPREDTYGYIRHRLSVAAGTDRDIFTNGALRQIHRRCGGIPRLINLLADRVLLAGYAAQTGRIGSSLVSRAATEVPGLRPSAAVVFGRGGVLAGGALAATAAALVFWLGAPPPAPLMPPTVDAPSPQARTHADAAERAQTHATRSAEPGSSVAPIEASASSPSSRIAEQPIGGGAQGEAASVSPEAAATESLAIRSTDTASTQAGGQPVAALATARVMPLTLPDFEIAAMDAELNALNGVIEAYGLEPLDEPPRTSRRAFDELAFRGLAVLSLEQTNLDLLRQLDHPALLELDSLAGAGPRLVALVGLEGGEAEVIGASAEGSVRLAAPELERVWGGVAHVVWRPNSLMPDLFRVGEQGAGVRWLQAALAKLGYFEGTHSGVYDRRTVEGVRAFQRDNELDTDGIAGPVTQMVLYDALEVEGLPRLSGELAALPEDGESG